MFQKPLQEVISIPLDRSFLIFSHDYPYPYTGWHYHAEYELHLIQRSSGSFYVGTYAGRFETGNLVMLGPNLPHMWVSDLDGAIPEAGNPFVRDRDLVLQFRQGFVDKAVDSFADCAPFKVLMEQSRSGILFSSEPSAQAAVLLRRALNAEGLDRLSLFFRIVSLLAADRERVLLSMVLPSGQGAKVRWLNSALEFIAENYNRSDLTCNQIAAREGMTISAFSHFFKRNVKCSCLEYVNRLRIYKSCQLLIETNDSITEICYGVGYEVLSTFERNFIRFTGVTPSEFRMERGTRWSLKPGQAINSTSTALR